jgi:hypothetical protein
MTETSVFWICKPVLFQSKIHVCLVAAISIFPIPVVFVLRNFYLSHVHPDLRFYFSLLVVLLASRAVHQILILGGLAAIT